MPELEKAVFDMSKVLKPGGRIVATFVNKWYAFEHSLEHGDAKAKKGNESVTKSVGRVFSDSFFSIKMLFSKAHSRHFQETI